MIKVTNATDGRENLISCQLGDVENTIRIYKINRLTRMRIDTELLPEVTAALVMGGYDVFVCRHKDGTSMSSIAWSIKRENQNGLATVHSELGGKFEQEYHNQVVAAIKRTVPDRRDARGDRNGGQQVAVRKGGFADGLHAAADGERPEMLAALKRPFTDALHGAGDR